MLGDVSADLECGMPNKIDLGAVGHSWGACVHIIFPERVNSIIRLLRGFVSGGCILRQHLFWGIK